MLGFGFDTTLTGLTLSDLTFVSSSTGEGITGLYTDTTSCGSGCNFNGAASAFDYIVGMGDQGSSNGLIEAFQFLIANTGNVLLDQTTFTRVGIRAQTVGPPPDGGGGSTKDINSVNSAVQVVPIPAALPLFASGVGILGLVARRRSRSMVNSTA